MDPVTNMLQNTKKSDINPKLSNNLNSASSKKNSNSKCRNDISSIEKINKTNNTNYTSKKNIIPLCFTLLTNKKNNINDLKFKFGEDPQKKGGKNPKSFLKQQPSTAKQKKLNLYEFRNSSNPLLITNKTQNKNFPDEGKRSNLISSSNQSPVSFILNLLNKKFSSFLNDLSPKGINSNSNNNSSIFNNNSIINSSNIHININNNISASAKKIFPRLNDIKQFKNIKMPNFFENNNKFNGISRNDKGIPLLDSYYINDNKKKNIKKSESFYDNSDSNTSKKPKKFKFSKWETPDKNNSNFDSNPLSFLSEKYLEPSEIEVDNDNIKNKIKPKKEIKKLFQNE